MLEFLALGMVAVAIAGALALLGVIALAIRAVLWLVLLPLRLLCRAASFGLGALFGGLGVITGLFALPLLLLAVAAVIVAAVVSALVAVTVPAIPFVLLGLLVWSLVKRPAPARI